MKTIALAATLTLGPLAAASEPQEADEPARAEAPASTRPEPRARFVYSNFLALRANPAGLVDTLSLGWRHRLARSEHPLLASTFVHLGVDGSITPANGAVGARVEIQPLAILNLSATYEWLGFFGTFLNVMTFGSTFDEYSDPVRRERRGENYATQGTRLTLSGLLQAKAGPVFVRSRLTALRIDLALREGEELFYDALLDLLVEDGGWSVVNDLDVGALVKKAAVGARYTYADALHGTGGPGDQPTHRVGPLFAWTFHDRPAGTRFNKPSLMVLAQWHVAHPWRAGQRSHLAYPLVALAFAFEGDLWISRR